MTYDSSPNVSDDYSVAMPGVGDRPHPHSSPVCRWDGWAVRSHCDPFI